LRCSRYAAGPPVPDTGPEPVSFSETRRRWRTLKLKYRDPYEREADERGLLWWLSPLGKLWLRGIARVLEYSTRFRGGELNLSRITDQLLVGGSIPTRAYPRLKAMGVTAVIDLREEARDDVAALERLGIELHYLPATDRYAATQEQLVSGVEWALERLERGGQVYAHCRHGVGRGPLMGLAILVAQGYNAGEALRLMRSRRWQAAPNDRQLEALVAFERTWDERPARRATAEPAPMGGSTR
jgi:protein-tyrosine phosphatase